MVLVSANLGFSTLPSALRADPLPVVKISNGVLRGVSLSTSVSQVAFLGVPCAAPAVGELRWKPHNLRRIGIARVTPAISVQYVRSSRSRFVRRYASR